MKKMFKKNNIRRSLGIVAVAWLIALTGCQSLDEPKPGFLDPDTFLETQQDALDLLAGAYSGQYSIMSYLKSWIILNDIGSDDCGYIYAEFPDRVQYDRFIYDPEYKDVLNMWWHHYIIVNRASLVVDKVAEMPDYVFDSPSLKKRIIAEARFLRDYNYFNLIRGWGDVPFYGESYVADPVGATDMERTHVNTIYDFILEDLQKAEQDLWDRTQVEKGRVTRGAAQALLAKVYLTRAGWRLDASSGEMVQGDAGNWSEAAKWAKKLIDEGQYGLLDSFRLVFPARPETYSWENNREQIYFINAVEAGPWFETKKYYGPRRFDNMGAYSSYVGEVELYNSFDPADKRLGTTYLTWVFDKDFNRRYSLTDPRDKWFWWPGLNIPHINKYLPDEPYYEYPPKENLSGTNYPLFRYAEVLLIYAEAENEANGPTGPAVEAFNEVRRRAGLSEWPAVTDPDGTVYPNTQEGFRQAIRQERRHELAFESKRLFDLRRWGILEQLIHNRATLPDHTQEDVIRAQNITKYHNLWPIPFYEIQRNPKLQQNPGL